MCQNTDTELKDFVRSPIILFVDDDEMILEAGKTILEHFGYQVLLANSGIKAVEMVQTHGIKINIIILDLVMPDFDGENVFGFIKKRHPDMPVILASGYGKTNQIENIMSKGCNLFIKKPYNFIRLSEHIQGFLLKEGKH